ncbi:MAG: ATP-binding protein [Acidobacteriaceae bacterium]|jgi:two-component system sensor histidine kinase KdpD
MDFVKRLSGWRVSIRALRISACLAFIIAITWVAFSVLHVNALIAGFAYVLAVLVVAAKWGLAESLVTSVVAMLCLNYFFLPPILSLTIADPQNWVALFVFMVIAITASTLSSSVRQRSAEAQARKVEVENLYQLSLSLMLVDTTRTLGPQIAENIKEQFSLTGVAYCDGLTREIYLAGNEVQRFDHETLHTISIGEGSWFIGRKQATPNDLEVIVAPVVLGGRILGSLGIVGSPISEPAFQSIANLTAISIEHARQQIAAARVEVARQNERLKGILLDALAHDFITPLTSIKGAITTVRSEYMHEHEEDDFLAVVEEEADKLVEMVTETVDMARIEPGKTRIQRRQFSVSDLICASLERMKSALDGRPLDIQIQDDISPVNADPDMICLALRQLLGNAIKFSPPGSMIGISADEANDIVTVRVRDHGPGVPPDEVEAIFERFYRGRRTQEWVPGTGMGLSIAREIINAHRGRLWAENMAETGAQFSFTLPIFR